MSIEPLILGSVVIVSVTSLIILISRDWRYTITALAIQYVGVFLLVNISWPIELAVVKMVAGWMAGAILGIAMTSALENWRAIEKSITFGPIFRLLSAAILAITITSLVLKSESWLSSIDQPVLWASFFLMGMGLLQISLSSNPMRSIIGLLTVLSGFEIIYAAVESSVLVTGLLAGVTLGLSLVGAYLLISPTMEISK